MVLTEEAEGLYMASKSAATRSLAGSGLDVRAIAIEMYLKSTGQG